MDLSHGVPKAKSAPRHGRKGVALVVHPLEVCDLRVEERRPGFVTHSGSPERDASDRRVFGEIELHEQRVEFREGSTERMANLYTATRGKGIKMQNRPQRSSKLDDRHLCSEGETDQDDLFRRMLGHQVLDFCED